MLQIFIKYFLRPEEQLKATSFKCLDGHVVRFKGELIIDNYLHKLGLAHKYEKTIKIKGEKVKYDWYLTDHDIYIEYWGFFEKVNVGKAIISLEKAEDDILKSFGLLEE